MTIYSKRDYVLLSTEQGNMTFSPSQARDVATQLIEAARQVEEKLMRASEPTEDVTSEALKTHAITSASDSASDRTLTPKQVASLQRIGRREMGACEPGTGSELINAGLVELVDRPLVGYGKAWKLTRDGFLWLTESEIPRMPNTLARKAYEALAYAVRNSGVDDEPVGDCAVTLAYHSDDKLYHADVEAGECSAGACAPTLELAILALSYCDEMECVEVNELGRALCRECHGDGCKECNDTGADTHPPHAWPKDGILRVLDKT